MSKEKTIGNQNPIQTTINKVEEVTKTKLNKYNTTKLGNILGFKQWDEGVDEEYFINEIIGIDELPYEEFIKEDEDKKPPVQLEFDFSGKDNFNYDE